MKRCLKSSFSYSRQAFVVHLKQVGIVTFLCSALLCVQHCARSVTCAMTSRPGVILQSCFPELHQKHKQVNPGLCNYEAKVSASCPLVLILQRSPQFQKQTNINSQKVNLETEKFNYYRVNLSLLILIFEACINAGLLYEVITLTSFLCLEHSVSGGKIMKILN